MQACASTEVDAIDQKLSLYHKGQIYMKGCQILIKKYWWQDRRYRVESGRHICRHSGQQVLRKHVCMTAILPTKFLLHFCLPVFLRPASLVQCACFNSNPTYSNTDLGRSRDTVKNYSGRNGACCTAS